jgi:lysophospholipase L1-like esterase
MPAVGRLVPRILFSLALLALLVLAAELTARRLFADALRGHPHISRNSLGFRDSRIGPKRPDRYRIVIIGDSLTFGQGIAERDRFSDVIQSRLGPGYEVLNFGTRAHNLRHHVRTLERALAVQPDFILLQLYENDFETARMRRPVTDTLVSPALDRSLTRSFVLYRLSSTAYIRLQQSLGLSEEYSHYMARHLENPDARDARESTDMLRAFIAGSHVAGVPVGAVMFPALWAFGRRYPFTYLHERVTTICQEQQISCLDLFEEFAHDKNPSRLWVDAFDAHPNKEANARAARQILYFFGPLWGKHGDGALTTRGDGDATRGR